MLDSVEVNALEKRWKKWRLKQITSRLLLGLIVFCIVPLSWLIYKYLPLLINPPATKTIEISKLNKPKEDKTVYKPSVMPENTKPQIPEMPVQEEEIFEYSKIEKPPTKTPPKQQIIKKEPIREVIVEPEEEYIEVEPEEEYIEVEPQKPRIDIQTSDIGGFSNLKEKFYQSNNIIFALMIAEEHYNNKDYKNSNKWALIANNIDSKNERSWIIFAKSMAKNGKPKKAIRALNAYLKTNPNASKISALIRKIKHGDY